jgi:ribosomal protein S18 acetylase RimI-like enzyme
MFLSHKQYLTFIKDPKYYKQVTDLLQEVYTHSGVQYFVHAGGYFAGLRTTGKEVIACARISPLLGSTGSYLIRSIVVDVKYRGKGLCPKLLKEVFRELKKKGATNLCLDVDSSNIAAVKCYTGVGFVPMGTKTYDEKTYTRMVKEFS